MITKLRGLLDSTGSNWAAFDVQGVFYQVFCSAKTLDHLRDKGTEYVIYTEMIVREDMMSLYGFINHHEREWFRLLTSVQGVGNKAALSILSAVLPEELHVVISTQNKEALTQADGVGPKLAGRIVNELKDKVPSFWQDGHHTAASIATLGSKLDKVDSTDPNQGYQDAVSALINLGYKPFEANQAVAFVKQEGHNTLEDMIRLALVKLSNRT